MNALFGTEFSLPMKFLLAFAIVLILIGAAAYLVRRFGAGALAVTTQRNRQPRLAVVDAADLDARRKLVIVRRDNVEHLLLIGGPTDVLVEGNIVRGAPAQAARDVPLRAAASVEPPPVAAAPETSGWPQLEPAPRPEPALRAEPPAARPEPVVVSEPPARAEPVAHEPAIRSEPAVRSEPIAKPVPAASPAPTPITPVFIPPAPTRVFPPPLSAAAASAAHAPAVDTPARAPEPSINPLPGLAAALHAEPVTPQPSPALQPAAASESERAPVAMTPTEEQNLAEMAQRLEAALRRPASGTPRPAAVVPPPPARARPVAPPQPPDAATRPTSPSYESLQREMANLLGRHSGSS